MEPRPPHLGLSCFCDSSFVCAFVMKPARVLGLVSLQVTPVKMRGPKIERKKRKKREN